jgi:hypothetical protein
MKNSLGNDNNSNNSPQINHAERVWPDC